MYVDPHVIRIWETVAEKRPVPSETVVVTTETETERETTPAVVEEATPSEESVPEEPSASIPTTTPPVVVVPEAPIVPPAPVEEAPVVPPSTRVDDDSPVTPLALLEETVTEQESPDQSPLFTPVVPPSDASPVPATEHESESAASVVVQSLHPGSVGVAAGSTAGAVEDVDEFLRDIGFGTEAEGEAKVESQEEPQGREEAGEEEAKAEEHPGAPVRADILARHDKWEQELQELVQGAEEDVKHALREIRTAAVVELDQYGSDKGKHEKRGVVGMMEEEAERFVKGLEGYLRGAEARVGMEKEGEVGREEKTWYRVLEKTEEKFSEKIEEVQGEVHGWYVRVREQEGQEVEKAVGFFLFFLFSLRLTFGLV